MKLTLIGTGYVGLVTGTCFAEVGHHVVCVDNDAAKVKLLQSGGIPIYEPGLEELIKKNVAAGRLSFSDNTAEGVRNSEVIFIAVPTPPQADGSVDLSFIEHVARDIAAAMTTYKIVVDKSTVPVRTGEKVSETIKRYCPAKVDFDVVSNPEFLREGFAVGDLMKPDRVVIGVRSQRPVAAMKEIYTPFNAPIVVTDINSAELIKHASNSFLALKISYINAISAVCEATGANVQEVATGMGLDERLHQNCRAKRIRFPPAQGSPAHQHRPDGTLRQENHRHPLGAQGQDHRRARPGLQAKHRRPPHVAGH
jgi:UDPglucose 6-dehydrogenase